MCQHFWYCFVGGLKNKTPKRLLHPWIRGFCGVEDEDISVREAKDKDIVKESRVRDDNVSVKEDKSNGMVKEKVIARNISLYSTRHICGCTGTDNAIHLCSNNYLYMKKDFFFNVCIFIGTRNLPHSDKKFIWNIGRIICVMCTFHLR